MHLLNHSVLTSFPDQSSSESFRIVCYIRFLQGEDKQEGLSFSEEEELAFSIDKVLTIFVDEDLNFSVDKDLAFSSDEILPFVEGGNAFSRRHTF